ncbi:tetratricopeptide repeat protein [Novosphingobium sp. M1R2S20]|uniref:Tetratricopeptide repeat protein n=1 Tax=Novosphingobium rhizovicinum TaxID=3228928 RepID=A0ABV3RGE0_9SPHN
MSWVFVILLAAGAFVVATFVLRTPRRGWEAIAAALLLGVAGYALQAHPNLGSAPKAPREDVDARDSALVEARAQVTESGIPPSDRWVIISDALARNGQFAGAAEVLRGAIADDPKNGEAWLAMANALVSHADGVLTPASLYAYRRAAAVAPDHPGPPFFLGLALAQSGRFDEASTLWRRLLAQTPADAPWRAELEGRINQLDAIIAAQRSNPAAR